MSDTEIEATVTGCTSSEFLPHIQARVDAIVEAARAAERERAAKVCEDEAALWRGEQSIIDFKLCAAAIRALK